MMRTSGFAILIGSVLGTCSVIAPADSKPIPPPLSQHAALKSLRIPVAIPQYVPNGFEVSQVNVQSCPPTAPRTGACRGGDTYSIVYRNPQNVCFSIESNGVGVGGADSEFEFKTQTSILGGVSIGFGAVPGDAKPPTPAQLRVPQPNLYSFPQMAQSRRSPYYGISVEEDRFGCQKNTVLTPLEFERIVKSLTWLK